jgi:hypothetical protein
MNSLTFTILYHRTLKNKTSERLFIEIKDLLNDKRFSNDATFRFKNIKEGITVQIEFVTQEEKELYLEILKSRDLYLAPILMSTY